jgi:hypothetical protein
MIAHLIIKYLSPRVRFWVAAAMLDLSVVAWPALALTVFRHEMQGILGLSFLAIIWTSFDVIISSDVRNAQEEK